MIKVGESIIPAAKVIVITSLSVTVSVIIRLVAALFPVIMLLLVETALETAPGIKVIVTAYLFTSSSFQVIVKTVPSREKLQPGLPAAPVLPVAPVLPFRATLLCT